jgi:prolyl-tRNA synthetase
MTEQRLPARETEFAEWYNQVVLRADLADYAPVRGCMIVKPYGWTLWENMQQALDRRFKATGHVNAAFPMLIPMSFIEREAEHVQGFAPELAVVTHGGGEQLEEPLVVRPTSETVIGWAYSKWIKSYRDLPVLINQWCSVFRWELRTRLFLRTAEFWWQEGHTAHATREEAEAEARQMLDVYADFAATEAALPAIRGRKSESERFPGADQSYSIEAMMGDRRALQAATSHHLGQNFARAFDIRYLDRANELQYCWTTSWGLSTRVVGAVVMVHGDDRGLILPPRLAPIQAVIVPIYKNDTERGPVMEAVARARECLREADVRVHVDDRDGLTPGFKFNDWELRGVPLRLEIGPQDVARGAVALARRDMPGKAGKSAVPMEGLGAAVSDELRALHARLFQKALRFQTENTREPRDYDDFKDAVQNGWAISWWCGDPTCEAQIKEDTRATTRVIPFEQPGGTGRCIRCGNEAHEVAVFGRAY